MVTADSITDEQIRELRDSGDLKQYIIAALALDEEAENNPVADRAELVSKARARCAEILNARAKDGAA